VRREILDAYLADNVKSRILLKDGNYKYSWLAQGKRKPVGGKAFSAQDFLIALAEGKQSPDAIPVLPAPRRGRAPVRSER
jgi:hypothetical protein